MPRFLCLSLAVFAFLTVSAVHAAPPPPVVAGVAGPHLATLSWQVAATNLGNGQPITCYRIFRATGVDGPFSEIHRFAMPPGGFVDGSVTIFVDPAAAPTFGHSYTYYVGVYDALNLSGDSLKVTVTPGWAAWPMGRNDSFRSGRSAGVVPTPPVELWETQGVNNFPRNMIHHAGVLYCPGEMADIYAYDAFTGTQLFSLSVGSSIYFSAPVVGPQGILYATLDTTNTAATLTAHATPSLAMKWSQPVTEPKGLSLCNMDPVIASNGLVIWGNDAGDAVAVRDAGTYGATVWINSNAAGACDGDTVVLMNGNLVFLRRKAAPPHDVVCVTSGGAPVWTRTIDGTMSTHAYAAQLAVGPTGRIHAGTTSLLALNDDGSYAWRYGAPGIITGLAAQADGGVVITTEGAAFRVESVDPTGSLRWSRTVHGNDVAEISPAVITADGKVIATFADGTNPKALGLLGFRESDGLLLWQWDSPETQTWAELISSPVVTPDGRIYVALYDAIYCLASPAVVTVSKTASPPLVHAGGEVLSYTVSWSNASGMTGQNLCLWDTLPAGLGYAAGSFAATVEAGATVSPSYATSWAGPWTAGEPADGTSAPLLLRWAVSRVGGLQSGRLTFGARVQGSVPDGTWIGNAAGGTLFDGSASPYIQSAVASATVVNQTIAPGGLTALGQNQQADLNWSPAWAGGYPVSFYQVFRAPDPAGPYAQTGVTAPAGPLTGSATDFTDGGLVNGSSYWYRVRAVDILLIPGPWSQTACGRPLDSALNPPTACAAWGLAGTGNRVLVAWMPGPSGTHPATGYAVYRTSFPGVPVAEMPIGVTAGSASWFVGAVDGAGVNRFYVRSLGSVSDPSPFSGPVSISGSPPATPGWLTAAGSDGLVRLQWSPAGAGTFPVSGYRVYRATYAGGWSVPASRPPVLATVWGLWTTVWIDTGAANGTAYWYTVDAFDDRAPPNESGNSNQATVVPAIVLRAALAATPSGVSVGEWFTVVLSLTNMGASAVNGVLPVLGFTAGAGLAVVQAGPVPPGPVSLAPGASLSFVWTLSASGVGVAGFTATGTGTDSVVGLPVAANAGCQAVLSGASGWSPTGLWHEVADASTRPGRMFTSGSPNSWWYGWDMTGTYNTGSTNSGAIVQTIGPVMPGDVLSFWSWEETEGGLFYDTRIVSVSTDGGFIWTELLQLDVPQNEWHRVSVPLGAYAGQTIMLKLEFDTVDGSVNDFAGWYVDDATVGPAAVLEPSISAPVSTTVGRWVQVVLTITNTGSVAATGVVPGLFTSGAPMAMMAGPVPAGPVTVGAGTSRSFTWTLSASGSGFVWLTATATGFDGITGDLLQIEVNTTLNVSTPAALAGVLTMSPAAVAPGEWFQVRFQVNNTGGVAADGVFPALQINAGGGLVAPIGGPVPGVPVPLCAFCSQTFVWTFSASGTGLVSFTATASGAESGSGVPVSSPGYTATEAVSGLRTAVSVTPAPPPIGAWIQIVLAATNTGASTVAGIVPQLQLDAGASLVVFQSGPSPAGPVTLGPGASQFFTWTYSVSGGGTLALTATAAGTDLDTGLPVRKAASLSMLVGVTGGWAPAGLWHTVTDGATPAGRTFSSGSPTSWWYGVAGTTTYETPGMPNKGALTGVIGPVAAGDMLTFWSWEEVEGSGASTIYDTRKVWISANGGAGWTQVQQLLTPIRIWRRVEVPLAPWIGQTIWAKLEFDTGDSTANAYRGWFADNLRVGPAASLRAALSTVPALTVPGQWVQVVLTVTNSGTSSASGVMPAIQVTSGGALINPVGGPVPAGPVVIGPGAAQAFTWTFSASGAGTAWFSATATGTDPVTSETIQASGTRSLAITSKAAFACALSIVPAPPSVGGTFQVRLTVTNTGGMSATDTTPLLAINAGAVLVSLVSGPVPSFPVSIPGFGTQVFTWTLSSTGAGAVSFTSTVTGTDSGGGGAIMCVSSAATIATPLKAAIAAIPASVPGETGFALVLSVTNMGNANVTGITATVWASTGPWQTLLGGPVPAGPVTLAPGAWQAFTWSFSGTGCGYPVLTATVTGTDSGSKSPVSVGATRSLSVYGDPWDPLDNTGAAGTLLAPATTTQTHGPHEVCTSDTYDWFRIPMTAGNLYHFDTVGGAGDNVGELYSDSTGVFLVASDDQSGGGNQFSFEYQPAVTATYYLRVRARSFGASCSGLLTYWYAPPPPPPVVTAAAEPHAVRLSWTLESTNAISGRPISRYEVWRATSAGGPYTASRKVFAPVPGGFAPGSATLAVDGAASPVYDWTYWYRIEAVDNAGVRGATTVSVKPAWSGWHRFRGDSFNAGYTSARIPDRLVQVWRTPIGANAYRGQVQHKGKVYTSDEAGIVAEFDALTGAVGPSLATKSGGVTMTMPLIDPDDTLWLATCTAVKETSLYNVTTPALAARYNFPMSVAGKGYENVRLNIAVMQHGDIFVGNDYGDLSSVFPHPVSPAQAWLYQESTTASYSGGGVVIPNGNVAFLASRTWGNLIALTRTGSVAWSITIAGTPANGRYVSPLALGPDSRLYAATTTLTVVRQDGVPAGSVALPLPATGIAIAPNGTIAVSMSLTGSSALVRCLNANLTTRWTATVDGGAATEIAPPVITGGSSVLVVYKDGVAEDGLCLLSLADGHELWNWHAGMATKAATALVSPAVTPDGWVYAGWNNAVYGFQSPPVLTVRKRVDRTVVSGGEVLSYTLSWSNSGLVTAFGMTFTDTMPNGTAWRAGGVRFWAQADAAGAPALSASAWGASAAGPWTTGEPADGAGVPAVLRWVVNRVAPGASGFLRFTVAVSATLADGDTIVNRASATVMTDPYVTLSDTASTAVRKPVIAMSLNASAATVYAGYPVPTFTLSFSNAGSGTATALALHVSGFQESEYVPGGVVTKLPAGVLAYMSWTTTGLSTTSWLAGEPGVNTADPLYLRWVVDQLGPGRSGSITFRVDMAAAVPCATVMTLSVAGASWFSEALPMTLSFSRTAAVFRVCPPGCVTATAWEAGGAVAVSWGPAAAGTFPVSRYAVWRATCGACGFVTLATLWSDTATSFRDAGVTAGRTLRYEVAAADTNGVYGCAGPPYPAVTVPYPPVLSAWFGPLPGTVSIGQQFLLTLSVSNSGAGPATTVAPSPPASWGTGTAPAGGPAPAGLAVLAPGDTAVFTWTATGGAPGTVSWTATATAFGGYSSPLAASGVVVVQGAAALAVEAHRMTAFACPGTPVLVTLTVTNTGTADATGVTASPFLASGPGGLVPAGGPWPAMPVTLAGGESATFTWTFTGGSGGTVVLTTTVFAADLNSGAALAAGPATTEPVGVVAASFAVSQTQAPASPVSGGPVAWRIVVANTGSATITSLTVADTVSPVVTGVARDAPAGFVPLAPASTGSGSWYAWTGAAVSLAPGAAFTFTITGTVGVVCASTSVSNTAWAAAGSLCGEAEARSGVAGFSIAQPVLSVAAALQQTPVSPGVGSPVTYRLVVTNTGAATVTDLVVADTVAPSVTGVSRDAPAPFAVLPPAQTASGTWYAWSGSGLSLAPGAAFTFTITGVVGDVCVQTVVSDTAFVSARSGCGVAETSSNSPGFVFGAPVFTISLAQTQAPATGSVGASVSWRLVVDNTGGAVITRLRIVDTLPAFVTGVSADTPGGFAMSVAPSPAGSVYAWENGSLSLTPGTVMTVTITGAVGPVCGPVVAGSTPWGEAWTGCAAAYAAAPGVPSFLAVAPHIAAVSVAQTQTPASPSAGGTVTYRIVVVNLGTATLTGLSVVDTLPGVITGAVLDGPSGFTALPVAGTPAGTLYSWSDSGGLVAVPGAAFTFTITGVVGTVCASTAVSSTAWAVGTAACGPVGASSGVTGFTVIPPVFTFGVLHDQQTAGTTGAPLLYRIIVTNTGWATISALAVVDTLSPVVTAVATGQPPGFGVPAVASVAGGTRYAWSGAASLVPGASFTFTVTGVVGGVCVSTRVSGTAWVEAATACGSAIQQATSSGFTVAPPASGLAAAGSGPASASVGQSFLVTLTVTNTGAAPVTGLVAAGWDSGGGAASLSGGPWPAGPASLAPGSGIVFTWTATAASGGTAAFTLSASGAACGAPSLSAASGVTVAIEAGAALVAALAAGPSPVCVGSPITVAMTVTNTGEAAASGVTPAAPRVTGAGSAVPVSGPVPGTPQSLAGGAAVTFVWVYTAAGAGEAVFSSTASGTDANSGAAVPTGVAASAPAWVSGTAVPLTVDISRSPASPVAAGPVSWTIRVTNAGAETVTDLLVVDSLPGEVALVAESNTGGLIWNGAAAGVVAWQGAIAMAPGATVTVTIDGTADACFTGIVVSGAWARGVSACGAGEAASVIDAFPLTALSPAVLVQAGHSPAQPDPGGAVTYTLVVTNASPSATLTSLLVTDTLPPAFAFVAQSDNAGLIWNGATTGAVAWEGPVSLPPGGSATITIDGVVSACLTGQVDNTGWAAVGSPCGVGQAASAIDRFDLTALTTSIAFSLGRTPASPGPGDVVTYSLVIGNTGTATLTAVTVTETLPADILFTAQASPPGLVWNAATTGVLAWAGSVGLAPGDMLTVTVTGVAACAAGPVGAEAWGQAAASCGAAEASAADSFVLGAPGTLAAAAASPAEVSTGQAFLVTLTVTNTGGTPITALVPDVAVGPGAGLVTVPVAPVPATVATLAPGASVTFAWTFTATGAGAVGLSATATGAVCGSATIQAAAGAALTVETAASLSAAVAAFPSPVCAGSPFLVTVTVTNTGGADATGVAAAAPSVSGAGSAAPAAGPSPAMPVTLAGGAALTFTWSFTAGAGGDIVLTATATGFDANSGAGRSSGPAVPAALIVGSVPVLSVSKTQTPAAPVAGGPVNYTIVVTNTGAATVTSVTVADTVSPVVTGVVATTPAGFTLQPVGQGTGGTVYGWVSTGPLLPGASATFQLDGTVGAICSPVAVGNTAFVEAQTSCGITSLRSNGTGFTLAPPGTGMTVVTTQTLPGPGIGTAFGYTIQVTNTGVAPITTLTVVDTVSPVLVNVTPAQPAPFGPPVVTSVATGTRYEWSATGLSIGPGVPQTFTLGGAVGLVCDPTGMANTAYVQAAVGCGTLQQFGIAPGNVVLPSANGMTVVQTLTPASPVVGGPVGYAIQVTNTGAATLTAVVVTDTVPPVLTGGTPTTPAGFAAPVVSQAAGGTLYTWTSTGPFLPGTVATFRVDGAVGALCGSGSVSNTAFVAGASACQAGGQASNVTGFVVAGPAVAITVTDTQSVPSPGTGAPLAYTIQVTNTGSATVTSMTVVDTVSPLVTGVVAAQPGAFGAPVVTSVAGGTRYEWSATGLALAPGGVYTFSLTGAVGVVCGPVAVGNTAFVEAQTSCGVTRLASNVTGFTLAPPGVSVAMVRSRAPASPQPGGSVSYTLIVQNTGAATLADLTVTDTLAAGVTFGSESSVPALAHSAAGPVHTWSGALTLTPGMTVTVTIDGTLACAGGTTDNPAGVTATGPCGTVQAFPAADSFVVPAPAALAGMGAATPSLTVGGTITVALTVTNTGGVTAPAVTPVIVVGPGAGLVSTLAAPTGAVPLAAGGSTTFAWTFATSAPGLVVFSVTASGGGCGGVTLLASAVLSTTIQALPAALAASLATSQSVISTGQAVLVYLTVTNTGGSAAANVGASIWRSSGAAGWSVTGPVPASVASLAPAGAQTFVFTVTGLSAGSLGFTATAGGDLGATSPPATASAITVQSAAALSAVLAASPGSLCVGQDIVVSARVTNTGQAGASVTAAPVQPAGAAMTPVAGPFPALPYVLAGGASVTFTWTYTAAAAGSVTFTTTVSGADVNSSVAVSSPPAASGIVTAGAPAALAAALSFAPATASVGQGVTVTLTVTNTGGTDATGVGIAATTFAGSGAFGAVAPASQTVPGGSQRTFSWTYTVLSAGTQSFSVTASGLTCGASTAAAATTGGFTATAPAALSGTLLVTPAGPVTVGQLLVASLTVVNTGGADANAVTPVLSPAGVTGLFAGPVPAAPVVIVAGGNRIFVWTFTVTGAGSAGFAASASGTDANSGFAIAMPGQVAPATAVLSGAALVVDSFTLTPGPNVRFTATLTATMVVRNTGAEAANVTALARSATDPAVLILPSALSAAPPFVVAGGAIQTITWTYFTAGSCGFSGVTATVTGTAVVSGSAVGAAASTPAVGVAGLPAAVVASAGQPKVEIRGTTPVAVTVVDGCGVPVPGAPVTAVIVTDTGGAAVSPASGVTDGNGRIVLDFRVGAAPGRNAIRIDVPSGSNPSATVAVEATPPAKPTTYLSQNTFNPGRGERLRIRIMEPAPVRLVVRVYNVAGELIRRVNEADVLPGLTVWEWDGRTAEGGPAANGMYFIQIQSGLGVETKRVVVQRK
ncbi:MAG: FlgD immunoglobulin-like domain containing protein [Candidatus Coatesbacteria bacterium]